MNEATVALGTARVLVRFGYEAEDLGHGSYPDTPASVTINEVRIGDIWVDSSFFDSNWLDVSESYILSSHAAELREDEAERRWDARQEQLMEGM